jgi:PAS domain S-box-containing protein
MPAIIKENVNTLLEVLCNVIPQGMLVVRAYRDEQKAIIDFTLEYANPALYELIGTTTINNKTFLSRFPDQKELFSLLVSVANSSKPGQTTRSFKTSTGDRSLCIRCAKLEDGAVLSFAIEVPDVVSLQKQHAEDVRFIQKIVATTPDIIYLMDLKTGEIIYTNRWLPVELGYSAEEIDEMDNPVLDIMHADDLPLMRIHLKSLRKIADDEVREIEYRLIAKNGDLHWYVDRNAVFKRNDKGIAIEKIGISQNISQRKHQEFRTGSLIALMRQAEQISAIGTWQYDITSGEFSWSPGMYKLFNLQPGNPVVPEIYLQYADEGDREKAQRIVNAIRRDYISFDEVMTIVLPSGEKTVLKIRAIVSTNDAGQPISVSGVDLDITGSVRSAEVIHELNNELISRNYELSNINSELRTFTSIAVTNYRETLRHVYTNLEFIASREARNFSDTGKANIRKAQASIQRMQLLTDDIVNFSRLNQLDTDASWVDLNEVFRKTINDLRGKIEQTNAQIESVTLPSVKGYPLLLSLLFYHLLDNSIKFRKHAATPLIRIKYSQADEMNFSQAARKDTGYAILSITDNGVGFHDEHAEKIFDIFCQLHEKGKYRGTGIGLAICKKIMTIHDGFITAEGVPAIGATFNCYFPLQP